MVDLLTYVLVFALLAAGALGAYWYFGNSGGKAPGAGFFGPRAEKRLAVVEYANVDGRRRLLLIRRDGVEHLVMTGGPVDVVIETGIGDRKGQPDTSSETADQDTSATPSTPVFSRPARTLGRAAQPIAE